MTTQTITLITSKQRNFIVDLAAKRDWRAIDDAHMVTAISRVLAWQPKDGTLLLQRRLASRAIDVLLKTAIVPTTTANTGTNTITAPPALSPKDTAQSALDDIPGAAKGIKYAVRNTDTSSPNEWVFYEVKEWKGRKYLNRLQGAPGDWRRQFVKYDHYAGIAQRIRDAGPQNAAFRFSEIYTVCACCGSPLSAGKSIVEGFGPVCIKKFN